MQQLRVWFCDMAPPLDIQQLYVYKILQQRYKVILDAHTPQVVFFSVYGQDLQPYLYKQNTLFMIGSEVHYHQNRSYADYAINPRPAHNDKELCVANYRFFDLVEEMVRTNQRGSGDLQPYYHTPKTLFCNFIYGNKYAKKRNDFFTALNAYKTVDSLGRYNRTRCRTTLPDWRMDTPSGLEKVHMLKHYRFSICFENSILPYERAMSEKVIQALMVGSIPIYWGGDGIYEYIHPDAIIDVRKFKDFDAAIQHIDYLENNPAEVEKIRRIPPFVDTAPIFMQTDENIADFIYSVVQSPIPKRGTVFAVKRALYPVFKLYAKQAVKMIQSYRKRWQS